MLVRGRSTVELVADGIVGRGSLDIQGLLRGDGILNVSRGLSFVVMLIPGAST